MDEKEREAIAVFRYGVIAPLLNGPLAPGALERELGRIASQEWSIPGTSRRRIARTTARDWLVAWRSMGFDGLKPQDRSDTGTCRALPDAVQDLLLALRRERPKASVESLIRAARLSGRAPAEVRMAPTTVRRLLESHGMPAEPACAAQPDALAFTFPHANDLWTSDLMFGPRLLVPGRRNGDGGGPKTWLYAFLDDATRMVPFAAFYPVENAACFQDALKQALLRRGIPRRLYCDNGSTFRTHHLEVTCATLNLHLIHSRPHQPRGRGKIERFFRHVRTAFLPHLDATMLTSLATLNRVFWAWLEAEYHQTPHGGLDGRTPLDRFMDDRALVRPAPDDLDALMRMRVVRRVAKDRTVRLDGRLFEAPDGYAGETVEVLYDPYDPLRPVHMRRKGEHGELLLRPLDAAQNATLRRVARESAPAPEPPAPTGVSYLELVARQFYTPETEEN